MRNDLSENSFSADCVVSVVMPNHNQGEFIEGALEAVLAQDIPLELIVVDDGSTDDSVVRVERMANRHTNLHLHQPGKIGSINASNYGLSKARGRYVCFFAPDDVIYPGLLRRSVALLESNPGVNVSFSEFRLVYESEGWSSHKAWALLENDGFIPPALWIRRSQKKLCFVAGATSLWRTVTLRAIGGWDERLGFKADWFLSMTEALRNGVCYIPEPLAAVRVADSSFSARGRRDKGQVKKIFDRILDELTVGRFTDVGPRFRESGALLFLGPDMLDRARERGIALRVWRPWYFFRVTRMTLGKYLPSGISLPLRKLIARSRGAALGDPKTALRPDLKEVDHA